MTVKAGHRRFTITLPAGVADQFERAAREDDRSLQREGAHLLRVGLRVRDAERSAAYLARSGTAAGLAEALDGQGR
jgi:hypothetical protein